MTGSPVRPQAGPTKSIHNYQARGNYMDRIFKLPVGVALFAFLALAGLMGMLAVQTVMAQDQPPTIPNAATVFDHNENSNSSITRYTAADPERKRIFWTLGGEDAEDFTIDGGTLRFKSPPDYEVPTDREYDVNGDGSITEADLNASPPRPKAEGEGDNVYKVTVRFGAGGEDGMGGDDDYDGDDLEEVKVTVNVKNVNEPGMVVISPMQPQVGTLLTPTLTDEDNLVDHQDCIDG